MEQLTKDQAIAFYGSGAWKNMPPQELAMLQMEQQFLCMPFDVFHKAVEEVLGRPVWTHEFGLNRDGMLAEIRGLAKSPTFDEIMALLPAEKTMVVKL